MRDFWKGRNVFITGGPGFLGSWLVGRLIGLDANPVCLVRDLNNWQKRGWLVNQVFGSVTDQPLIERILGEYGVRTVFHLAAQAQVGVAARNPVSTYDTNVRGTWSVLEACRRSPLVEQVVVASSDKAYGEQPRLPYTEDMPLLGVYPYDASKACADRLAQSYAYTWGLPVAITRLGNLFGGGDRTWSRLVPGTIRRLLRDEPPLIRGDGSAIRDWLYVEDAVDAYVRLAEWLERKTEAEYGQAFNVSIGVHHSVADVIDRIQYAMGLPILREYDHEPALPGEIPAQSLDCSKARGVLGWHPRHTMQEGLEKTVAWYRENL